MKNLSFFGFWLALVHHQAVSTEDNYIQKEQFPYFGHILSIDMKTHCGATIIAPKWLITAAHCFSTVSSELEPFHLKKFYHVFMGGIKTFDKTAVFNKIERVIIHPGFIIEYFDEDPSTGKDKRLENDVALVELKSSYAMSATINRIVLPQGKKIEDETSERCKKGFVIGSNVLGVLNNEIMFNIINTKNRNQLAQPRFKPCVNTIFYSEITKIEYENGALLGDRGGPFVCRVSRYSTDDILYGIVMSAYNNTINGTVITTFESVEKHMGFILKHVPNVSILK